MVTLFNTVAKQTPDGAPSSQDHDHQYAHPHAHAGQTSQADSYSTYQEPDTRIPPKARPVFNAVSVNGIAIAESDILTEAQNHPAKHPGEALASAARALVVRSLLLQKARDLGLTNIASDSQEALAETPEDQAIRLLIEQEVKAPQASDAECRRYYERNSGRFLSEEILEASHILLNGGEEGDVAGKALRQARELAVMLAEKPDLFADFARQHSICPSGAQGGNLGQITRGTTVPEFEAALDSLSAGEITPQPVRSRYGYHIIRLERRIAGKVLPFDYVANKIAAFLEASAWSKAVSQYVAILAADATITGIDILSADGPLLQ